VNLAEALPRKGLPLYDSVSAIPAGTRRAVVLLDQSDFDLLEATERAIRILSQNPKGGFLMVDWDLHTDNLIRGLERTIVLDSAIQRVAEHTKDRTLILFTADHSFDIRVRGGRTGRPLLEPAASGAKAVQDRPTVRVDDGHTGEQVSVAAQGPGATRVHGYLANTDLFRIMVAAYGLERWRPGSALQAPR
jgi:alkaline phosphatase